ncbi:MAG: MBL fold metallo-hydrolase [Treponema sp.]
MIAQKILDSAYFVPCFANIGIIIDTPADEKGTADCIRDIYLVDSGGGDEEAAHVLAALDGLFPDGGYCVRAIINTHAHADHAGGNVFMQKMTGCEIWCSEGEAAGLQNPLFQEAVEWGGNPIAELKSDLYIPQKCRADKIVSENGEDRLKNGGALEYVPLPGHYFDMIGVRYTDPRGRRVLFAGDSFLGRRLLAKYGIPYVFNVEKEYETLAMLAAFKADFYLPSHGELLTSIAETIEENQIALLAIEIAVMRILREAPRTFEDLLLLLARKNGIEIKSVHLFILIEITLRAYLVYLREAGKVDFYIEGNRMFWGTAGGGGRRVKD